MRVLITVCFSLFISSLYSQTAEFYYQEGLDLKKEKKSKDAADKFMQALELKKDYTEARYELGWCQNELGMFDQSMRNLRLVRAVWNNVPKVFFELGYAFDKSKMTDSALTAYLQCVELKPDYSGALRNLGNLYYNSGENEKALNYYKRYLAATKIEVTDYLIWYKKGFLENALKDYTNAKQSLYRSVQYKADHMNTCLELGFACSRLKQNDSAIYYYQKAIDLDPKNYIPYNGIGEVYRDNMKDYDKATEWYTKAMAIDSKERKANFGIGYCMNARQRYAEAIPYLRQAVASENTYTAAFVELGYSLFKTGSITEALEKLNRALQLNPKNENARYYAVLAYEVQKNKALAQKMVDELRVLNSKYTDELQQRVDKIN